ncbi:DinB family protein [Anatilimnocola sp. NA78]|uniref:DinB family protein n=1 Tax=Anatilimnocola sp. NA78 TaxID=3415683 RepID=UPI003CE491BA
MDPRLDLAIKQIEFARTYLLTMLIDFAEDEWFQMPAGASTHLAWQIGHLAMAQYGLVLFRQRGRQPEDLQLMTSSFRKQFSRGTTPDPDPAKNPPAVEIRATFDRVYHQAMIELPNIDPATLDEPIDMPYAAYATKYGSLLFCSHHEMLHVGQIGVLRRLLGKSPIR